MQTYLFIGGGKDGLSYPAPDDAASIRLPLAVTDKETYARTIFSVGDASTII
jgi:hypothetical protein